MNKLLKKALFILSIMMVLGLVAIFYFSNNSTKVVPSGTADDLALQMLDSLNVKAWHQLKYIHWKSGNTVYYWHKPDNLALIQWDSVKVAIDLHKIDGKVYVNGAPIEEKQTQIYLQQAWKKWCNDSFWMFAHYKLFEAGTIRSLFPVEEAWKGLQITYTSGGTTPGDAYLWLLNEHNIPVGFKMWASIVSEKGLFVSWEKWTKLKNGLMVAPFHASKTFSFQINDITVGNNFTEIGLPSSIDVML